jgi:hypothetical protein
MIYFGFNIDNPWCKRWTNVWNKVYPTPHKSKYIELEVFKDSTIVSFSFKFSTRQDHAGLTVEAGLLGYSFLFQCYDIRHWNSEEGRWMIYTEEKGLH